MGIKSPVRTLSPTYYLDFVLKPGSSFVQYVPQDWTTFIYTLNGHINLISEDKNTVIKPHCTVVFSRDRDCVQFQNEGESDARFVLISGLPINEPVIQHGPFVMNTRQEITQTIKDYQEGKNGFEMAKWESSEGNK